MKLQEHINTHKGKGIHKWTHYIDIYERYFNKFVGKPVNVLEIGVFSGGSLELWEKYFGPDSNIYGVDIEEKCKKHEGGNKKVFIGNQGDVKFWEGLDIPLLDIVIDDGGHFPPYQIITMETLLPKLNLGGVYICEDTHGENHDFINYTFNLVKKLNSETGYDGSELIKSSVQETIYAIHYYPFMVVIERVLKPYNIAAFKVGKFDI